MATTKGEQTRELILARAAPLFNQQGYFGASLSDIMRETGLEKGGIYNHFASKEELALEAFDYSTALVSEQIRQALAAKTHSVERLLAMAEVFRNHFEAPPLPGGCPVLNTAIEADDAHPVLRERARKAMDGLRESVRRIISRGIEKKEIRPEADADECATIFIATVEGALMLSKLYGDPIHLSRAIKHLETYIKSFMQA